MSRKIKIFILVCVLLIIVVCCFNIFNQKFTPKGASASLGMVTHMDRSQGASMEDKAPLRISTHPERSLEYSDSHAAASFFQNNGFRKIENKAFTVGEWLRFDIDYGFIHAGTATMAIPEYRNINDRKCYFVHSEARNAAGFAWIFRVEDKYETYIDVEGIFPWRFERHIREGGYKADDIVEFDQYNHFAKVDDKRYPVPEYIHDILSAFYFVRTQDFSGYRSGQIMPLKNFYGDKIYDLNVKFLGKMDESVEAGKFHTIVVEPLLKDGGLFKHQGRMIIWLTDDDRKIPVKVTTGIIVGSITIELEAYAGINGNIDAKK